MKDLGESYTGPVKYMSQRDAPLDIPLEVVKKLFVAMDQDMDDFISVDELLGYVRTNELSIETETVIEMFNHAASYRRVTQQSQLQNPLAIEEI